MDAAPPPVLEPSSPLAPQPLRVLGYQTAGPVHAPPSRRRRLVLCLLGLPAAATPFLPFTFDVAPFTAVKHLVNELLRGAMTLDMWLGLLGPPFFMAVVLLLFRVRLTIRAPASQTEGLVMLILAATSAAGTLSFCARLLFEMMQHSLDWFPVGICLAAIAIVFAGAAVLLIHRRHFSRDDQAATAVQLAYLSNAAICLPAFVDEDMIGWWMTGVAVLLILAEWGYRWASRCASVPSAGRGGALETL